MTRVALISGGGTGIGAAIAARLAADGEHVVVLGRRAEPLHEVAAATGALPIVADVADREQADAAVADVLERFGRLDTVVANAGGHGYSSVVDTTDDEWRSSLHANLDTAFVLCRAALPALRANRARGGDAGAIVIVSSIAGLAAGPEVVGYTVGKHALLGLARSMARDFGPDGVRVNTVCPGWVRTPMADAEMDGFIAGAGLPDRDAGYREVTRDVPLGRPAEPAEIANAVRFLASPEASYISGATLVVDGGSTIVDVPTIAIARLGDATAT